MHENIALAIKQNEFMKNNLEELISDVLRKVELIDRIDQRSGDLSYGHQRLLELAMGMAQEPKLLILDETYFCHAKNV